MKKTKIFIAFLLIALILSNAIWAYGFLNLWLISEYQEGFVKARDLIIDQMYSVVPIIATGKATREEIVSAAQLNGTLSIGNQNKSYVQVGPLTFKFDKDDNFLEIVRH
ncbi:MAG: hypothetical protein HY911_04805 [Desulfobacterales bacterium]|nr:hypothetical protein [Desulfobacterales bacterium]